MTADALELLGELAQTHRRLATFAPDVARAAAPRIEAALRESAAAGKSPDGKPWSARKAGGAPYVHAGDAIAASPIGSSVRVTLKGPEVYGHFGFKGAPPRPMLPDPGTIPAGVEKALREAADEVFAGATR